MADIALRTYLEEVDGLIDGNRIEEAITHLKHILGIYPKALDAYRSLAKALLEKNRHLDAADVFQRVLSSVPDDFISHIGMAVVREDEGNLDAAIWHMERAYEVQPSNLPIQEELRRLYGKRDGTEPPRLRLSRAALARMYEKGDLYQQAIGELRAALSDEPDRLDLKVLLASTLWRSRQRAEAAETSAKLLEVLPYCKEANRILADVWHESGRPQDAISYRRRLEALDPYEAFADPAHNGHGAEQVAAEQVVVPHLDNVYGAATSDASRPDWMEALGIQYEEPAAAPAADSGDWLTAVGGSAATMAGAGAMAPQSTDWLSALRGEDQQSNLGDLFQPTTEAAPVAESNDAPDWLSGIGLADSARPVSDSAMADTPDWLTGVMPTETSASPQSEPAFTASTDDQSDEIPDWMQSESVSASRPAARPEPPPVDEEAAASGMTGWLSALGEQMTTSESAPATASDDDVPDWLKQSVDAEPARPSKTFGDLPNAMPDWMKPTDSTATGATGDVEVPEWLQGEATQSSLTPESDTPDWLASGSEPAPTSAAPQSDLPDWLSASDSTMPAQAEVPDWLSASSAEKVAASPAPDATASPEVPSWLSVEDTVVSKKAPARPAASDLPSWLSEGAVADSASEPETPAWLAASVSDEPAASPASDLPSWLSVEDASRAEAATPGVDVPDWLTATPTETPVAKAPITSQPVAADVPSWLQASVSEPDSVDEDAPAWLSATPAAAEVPDWLSATETTASTADELSSEEKVAEMSRADEEIPEWMKAAGWVPRDPSIPLDSATNLIDEPEATAEAEPEPAPGDVPDWLKAMKPPEEARPAPQAANAPDWLRAAMEGETTDQPQPAEASALPKGDLPDWLAEPPSDAADSVATFLDSKPIKPAAEIPDWLAGDEPDFVAQPEPTPTAKSDVPDWLQVNDSGLSDFIQPIETTKAPGRDTAEAVAAFLREQSAPPTIEQPAAAAPAPTEMSEDEALAWLEGLAAKQGASEEELVTKRSSDLPDWLRKPTEPEAEPDTSASVEPAATPADSVLDWLQPPSAELPATTEPATMSDNEALAWLEGLAAKQGANPEELVSKPATEFIAPAPEEGLPDWLQAPAELTPSATSIEDSQATLPMDFVPTPPAEPAAMSDDEALAWLEGLAAKQGANVEELVTKAEDRTEQAPAWVQAQTEVDEPVSEAEPTLFAEPTPFAEPVAPEEPVAPLMPVATVTPIDEPTPIQSADMSADEALAWLEGLAAKQGANAEELVSKPESRADEMPAWIQAQADAAAEPEPTPVDEEFVEAVAVESRVDEKPDWLKQMEAEADQYEAMAAPPPTPEPEPVAQPEMSEDEALAWLEALAAKQGANPEELVSKPESRADEMPAWIQTQADAAVEAERVAESVASEAASTAADEKPDWLKQMEAEADQYEVMAKGPTVTEPEVAEEPNIEQPATSQETPPELPAWLAEQPVEAEIEPKIRAAWLPSSRPAEPEPAAEESAPPELPAWLSQSTEPEPEPEPKIRAAWLPSISPVEPEPEPEPAATEPAELPAWLAQPVEAESPSWVPMTETAEPPQTEAESETPPPAAKRPKKPRSPAKPRTAKRSGKLLRSEEPEIVLALARQRLAETNIDNALEVYGELINSGHLAPDVINDLEAATLKHPEQPELLRILGDAYMRDNQLQKALEAYKQALLRV